jgi:hypothetical protein
LARRFTMRTRFGSASALKIAESVRAWSGETSGAATGVQHATGVGGI